VDSAAVASAAAGVALVADAAAPGRRRPGRRRAFLGVSIVIVVIAAGGATAWAVDRSGNSGYRLTKVVHASVGESLDVVGTIQPVNNAAAAFQVAGKVTAVTATLGEHVAAGQALATLDTTALSESVSSAQSSVEADQAKLAEDEDSQTAGATTTTTTTPSKTGSAGEGASDTTSASTAVTHDEATLVGDQDRESTDQQKEAADLTQAESVCGASTPDPPTTSTTEPSTSDPSTSTPPSGTTGSGSANNSACETALQQAYSDGLTVLNDQKIEQTDENTLANALSAEGGSTSSTGTGTTGSGTAGSGTSATGQKSNADVASDAGSGDTGSGDAGTGAAGTGGTSAVATASQIASDEAAIDNAQSTLIDAQQSLDEAQLTSPISGTIASVGLVVGDTVGADSTTEVIQIIGTESYEVTGTLASDQVSSVKVGFPAAVAVDGLTGSIDGTVSQVGPVQSSTDGYSYPVVVALPASASGLFSGSTANVSIGTGGADNVLVVPTSAVMTTGTVSYVDTLSSGNLTRKVVKVGIVGEIYTQILSGLKLGTSVVLADLSEAVPSSNATTTGGFGGFGGGGAGRFGGGAGGVTFSRVGATGGAG
jgi:HlyD family secretion protein